MGETIEKLQRDVAQWKPGTTSQQLENDALMVESVLLAEKKQRGRPWLPGQSGNPAGRPTKARELALLDAISGAFSPAQVTDYMQRAMDIAVEQKSARGIVAVLEFQADRTAGRPTVHIQQQDSGLASILAVIDGRE